MKNYFLISPDPADFVQCGQEEPIYDHEQRVWVLANGNKHSAPEGHYTLIDDTASAPKVLSAMKTQAKAIITALRYEKEVSGITVNGMPIDTDRDAQAKLTGAKVYLDASPDLTINWKGADGVWRILDKTVISAVSNAVAQYVQSLYTAESTHHASIDACATLGELSAHDVNAGWPQQNNPNN